MVEKQPVTIEMDARFSDPAARPTPWEATRAVLAGARVYWLSTVRPDGRSHVTPLLSVWHDGVPHLCTGRPERKALNLADNPRCALTTGNNGLDEGLDVVVEGEAVRVLDAGELGRLAVAYEEKYGSDWHFDVGDGVFLNEGSGEALVYAVVPDTVFAFAKGVHSQTRYQF